MSFDFCPIVLYDDPGQYKVPCLLDYVSNLSALICTSRIEFQVHDISQIDIDILKDIKDNVCYAASTDMIEDKIYKIQVKYKSRIESLGIFKIINKLTLKLMNRIDVLPECKWIILTTFLELHENVSPSQNNKLIDILVLLCAIDVLNVHYLVFNNCLQPLYNVNSLKIAKILINNMFNNQNIEHSYYNSLFSKMDLLYTSTLHAFTDKNLFRAYIFAFSNDHNFLVRYNAFFDRLVTNTTICNIAQPDSPIGAMANIESDEIIYTIFKTYDLIYTHIINNFK